MRCVPLTHCDTHAFIMSDVQSSPPGDNVDRGGPGLPCLPALLSPSLAVCTPQPTWPGSPPQPQTATPRYPLPWMCALEGQTPPWGGQTQGTSALSRTFHHH